MNPAAPVTKFVGKMTITTSIKDMPNFEVGKALSDLKRSHLAAYKQLKGATIRNRFTFELMFGGEQAKQILLTYGLNTQGRHLAFAPDVPDATAVTLFNAPLEMPDDVVDRAVAKFGTIVSRYRHKQRHDDLVLLTGRRVYKVKLDRYLPRRITIDGHTVNTLYTGQREEAERLRKSKVTDGEVMVDNTSKSFEVESNDEKKVLSFLHPTSPREVVDLTEEALQKRHRTLLEAESSRKLKVIHEPNKDVDRYQEDGMVCTRINDVDLLALTTTKNLHLLPKSVLTATYTIHELVASSYYFQFGPADKIRTRELDPALFPPEAVTLWEDNYSYAMEDYADYLDDFASLYSEYFICVPDGE